MEPFTLNRGFLKDNVIDGFTSLIWTERYYGNSEFELTVPASPDMISKLPKGKFVGVDGSAEIMILETRNFEDNKMKVSGMSLMPWLNNRFVRTSPNHEDRYWYMSEGPAGRTLWFMIYYMCVQGSQYLDGTWPTGIPNPQRLVIPGLHLIDYDATGENIYPGIPYGPLYDRMRELAVTHGVGIQIILEWANASGYSIGFRAYRGLNRTSAQTANAVVRFSPQMDSFTSIKEVESIAPEKNLVFAFAPGDPDDLTTVPGISEAPVLPSGFDLRADQIFAEDVTTDMVGGSAANMVTLLNGRALNHRVAAKPVQMVDGEIVPTNQFKFGIHYNLGDIVETQGNSGLLQAARVTEYIRTHDATGQKSYPTVEIIV
jgi:hypothetical protein